MKYVCPHCGEILTAEEAESVCDCGCPSCRMFFDVEDYEIEDEKS
jgi:phage FluMu protein Com